MDVKRVGVIGAGTMGHGIAQVLAVSGYDVVMRDISDEIVQQGLASVAAENGSMITDE